MTRKLSALQTLVIHFSQPSSHALYCRLAATAGQIPPAGHAGTPGLTLRGLLLILAEAELLARCPEPAGSATQQDKQGYQGADPDHAQLARSDFNKQLRRDVTQALFTILLNDNSIAPDFAVTIPGIHAAQRQRANRKTLSITWQGPAPAEGGSRALRSPEGGQGDWQMENRNAPLLEFLQLALPAVFYARNSFQENLNAHAPSPSALCPLTGPDSVLPAGPQPSALPGTPSAPASESPLPWQASAPPDEAESRQPSGGRRPRLRRHSAQPAAHYERRSEGYAASSPPTGEPAASEPSGTDVRAMRTYSALIRQTREEDRAELETLGGQIQAARAALGVSRKQLVTLLHLDLELLVALEHGCGDVATARLVLEQVSAVVERRRRAAAVQ